MEDVGKASLPPEHAAAMATAPAPDGRVTAFTKPTKCYLLELPSELSNYIVELAVVEQVSWAPKQPSIALTCRQLRAQTLPVFYGQTHTKHTSLIHNLEIQFCDTHGTHLSIQVSTTGTISYQVDGKVFPWTKPLEKCPTVVAGKKSKSRLQRSFNEAGHDGLTADTCIQAGILVFHGSTVYEFDADGKEEREMIDYDNDNDYDAKCDYDYDCERYWGDGF